MAAITITEENLLQKLNSIKFGKIPLKFNQEEDRITTDFNGSERVIAFKTYDDRYRPTLYGLKLIANPIKPKKTDDRGKKKSK